MVSTCYTISRAHWMRPVSTFPQTLQQGVVCKWPGSELTEMIQLNQGSPCGALQLKGLETCRCKLAMMCGSGDDPVLKPIRVWVQYVACTQVHLTDGRRTLNLNTNLLGYHAVSSQAKHQAP